MSQNGDAYQAGQTSAQVTALIATNSGLSYKSGSFDLVGGDTTLIGTTGSTYGRAAIISVRATCVTIELVATDTPPASPAAMNTASLKYPGLVSYWPTLSGGAGATLVDLKAANNFTLESGVTRAADADFGQALVYDGTSNARSDSPTVAIADYPFQIAVRFKTTSTAGGILLNLAATGISNVRADIAIGTDGKISGVLRNGAGTATFPTTTEVYNDGAEHTAIFTLTNATSRTVRVDSEIVTDTTNIPFDTTIDLITLGALNNGIGLYSEFFDGSLAHPAYWVGTVMDATNQAALVSGSTAYDLLQYIFVAPEISIGTNSPAYDNILASFELTDMDAVNVYLQQDIDGGTTIPASTGIYAKLQSAAVAQAQTAFVEVLAHYQGA